MGRNWFYGQLSVPMDKNAVIFTEEQNIVECRWIRHGKIWQLHSEWEKHISMKFYNYFLDGKKSKKMWKLFSARENNCPTERKWSRPLIRFSPQPLFCHSHLSCKKLFRINIRGKEIYHKNRTVLFKGNLQDMLKKYMSIGV